MSFFLFFFLIIFLRTQVRNRRTCTRRVHEHDILSESMLNSICSRAGNTVHVVLFILGEGGKRKGKFAFRLHLHRE